MGADLFIRSLFDPQQAKWQPRFDRAVSERDRLARGTPEWERAQRRVWRYFARMQARGYFRDPYNDWDVLWKFELSWWNDVGKLLDRTHRLSVANAEKLLKMMRERETVFELNVRGKEHEQHFRKCYRAIQHFLGEAITRREPIECSI
jgi:hypothetical protein